MREEGRTGRVRSQVAADRFGSLKSLQFYWKAAARCTPAACAEKEPSIPGEGHRSKTAAGRDRGFPGQKNERERNHNTATWISATSSPSLCDSLTHHIDFEPVCLNTRTLQPAQLLLILQGGGEEGFSILGPFFFFFLSSAKNFSGSSWCPELPRRVPFYPT